MSSSPRPSPSPIYRHSQNFIRKGVVAWMSGNIFVTKARGPRAARHCAWSDVKPLTKVKIQPGSSVSCEQSENIERFRENEGQLFQPLEKFVRFREYELVLVWELLERVSYHPEIYSGNYTAMLVPRRFLLAHCSRKIWERTGESLSMTSQFPVEFRFWPSRERPEPGLKNTIIWNCYIR